MSRIPVIAIDGPAASGKGTVAARVAALLGFAYLDSGALYRLVALAARKLGIGSDDATRLAPVARDLDARFSATDLWLDGEQVTDAIREESISAAASQVAAHPQVRDALLERQRAFLQPPGLVAEGRDMGTVVFPRAALKIFLTASAQVRAERRYKQLMEKGLSANMQALLNEIRQRDARDSARTVAPLKPAADAVILDTTDLEIHQVVDRILLLWQAPKE